MKMKYPIKQKLLPNRTLRRSGILMPRVSFTVAHDTGNPGSSAEANVNYYTNSANTMEASAHIFVDDKQIIECIPALLGTPEKAWHVLYNRTEDNIKFGADANDVAIGVELCYGGAINFQEAYKRYVWVLAYIHLKFKTDPRTHLTGHEFLDPGRKTDPSNALNRNGITFKQLVSDVTKEYNALSGASLSVNEDKLKGESVKLYREVTLKDDLNVRASSLLTAPIVGIINKGTKVYASEHFNGMYRIGQSQWISAHEKYSTYKSLKLGTGVAKRDLVCYDSYNRKNREGSIIKKGKKVNVYSMKSGSYHIGKKRYIIAEKGYVDLTKTKQKSNASLLSLGKVTIKDLALNIRKKADLSSDIVGILKLGDVKNVYEIKNGMYRIGVNKWISANEKYSSFKKKK